jgi:hypothetical protein
VDGAGVEIHPGESADFTAFVVNPLTTPVTLISATVVPVTGTRPTGQLVHLGISEDNGMVAAADGWPLTVPPIRKLVGARIGHGQSNIIFGWPALSPVLSGMSLGGVARSMAAGSGVPSFT